MFVDRRTPGKLFDTAFGTFVVPVVDRVVTLVIERSLAERITGELLAAGTVDRIADQILRSPLPERMINELLESGELDRIVAEVIDNPASDQVVDRILVSEELQRVVRHIVASPEVRGALAESSAGMATEVAAQVRSRAVLADARAERAARRLLRRES